jgi:hypothetical protein
MATYYLKAANEQALWEAMETAGLAYKDYVRSDWYDLRQHRTD